MYRVVRPGGRVAACVWGWREACGWNAIFSIVEANIRTEVCPLFFTLGAPGMLAGGLQRVGFDIEQEERESRPILWPTDEYACSAAFAAGPVALAYSRLDPATKSAMHRQLLESIAPFRSPDRYRVPGEFVYVNGVRRGG